MQPTQKSNDTAPTVVRLGLGASAVILGAHLVFAGLRGLLNLWIALTPGRDRRWNTLRLRA
jgi:hypothetical protein